MVNAKTESIKVQIVFSDFILPLPTWKRNKTAKSFFRDEWEETKIKIQIYASS